MAHSRASMNAAERERLLDLAVIHEVQFAAMDAGVALRVWANYGAPLGSVIGIRNRFYYLVRQWRRFHHPGTTLLRPPVSAH